jgi:hypothetical protein
MRCTIAPTLARLRWLLVLAVIVTACRSTYDIPAAELPRFDGARRGTVRGVRTTDGDRVDIEAEDLVAATPVARDGFTLMVHPRSAVAYAVADDHVQNAERAGWSELDHEMEMPLRARIHGQWLVVDDGTSAPLALPGAAIHHVSVARHDEAKTVGLVVLGIAGAVALTAAITVYSQVGQMSDL